MNKNKFKVINVLWPQIVIFRGKDWECNQYIENKYGSGLKAIVHQVLEDND